MRIHYITAFKSHMLCSVFMELFLFALRMDHQTAFIVSVCMCVCGCACMHVYVGMCTHTILLCLYYFLTNYIMLHVISICLYYIYFQKLLFVYYHSYFCDIIMLLNMVSSCMNLLYALHELVKTFTDWNNKMSLFVMQNVLYLGHY